MSHQGTDGLTCSTPHHQDLKRSLDWLLASARLSDLTFRGDCSWTPTGLIFMAILWAWSDEKSLTKRFSHARKVVIAMGILARVPAATYQAFLKTVDHLDRRAGDGALRRPSPTHAIGPRRTVRGLRISRSSASTAAVSNCPAPNPTRGGSSPAKARRPSRSKAKAKSRRRAAFAGVPRPPRPPEEGEQPADVADDDVPCRHRVALGLADSARPTAASATTCGR